MSEAYDVLMSRIREVETIGQIQGLLGWDQEVMMPPKAGPLRAEQLAWLSKTSHALMTDPEMGIALSAAEAAGRKHKHCRQDNRVRPKRVAGARTRACNEPI